MVTYRILPQRSVIERRSSCVSGISSYTEFKRGEMATAGILNFRVSAFEVGQGEGEDGGRNGASVSTKFLAMHKPSSFWCEAAVYDNASYNLSRAQSFLKN